jgi:hypothetical protein
VKLGVAVVASSRLAVDPAGAEAIVQVYVRVWAGTSASLEPVPSRATAVATATLCSAPGVSHWGLVVLVDGGGEGLLVEQTSAVGGPHAWDSHFAGYLDRG